MPQPVLIVGAGLVGLSTALALHHHGVPAVVIDKHASTSTQPKARRFNFRTMEILRSIGIADAVYAAAEGLAAHQAMRAGRTLADSAALPPPPYVDYSELLAVSPESSCLVAQDVLEPVLLRAVRERGIPVGFGTTLTGVVEEGGGVTAEVTNRLSNCALVQQLDKCTVEQLNNDTDGQFARLRIHASHLIAADGAHSTIRDLLRIPFPDRSPSPTTPPPTTAVTVYFRADLGAVTAGREFNLCQVSEPIPAALASVDGRYRWILLTTEPPADPDWPEVVRGAIGVPGVDVEVSSVLRWRPATRVAERLRVGRVFLAGDAAHVMTPYAAMGANTGIQDAANLAWKIAAVRAGTAGSGLLETYHVERHAAGTHAAVQSALRSGPPPAAGGDTVLDHPFALVAGFQYTGGAVVDDGAGAQPRDRLELSGRPGTRMPHVPLDGGSTLDLAGPGLTLLPGPAAYGWRRAAAEYGIAVADPGPEWPAAARIAPDGALLVRPDHVVAWRSVGAGDAGTLAGAYDMLLSRH